MAKHYSAITFTTADCLRAACLRRPRLALLSVELSRAGRTVLTPA